jgi:hypothetical protein
MRKMNNIIIWKITIYNLFPRYKMNITTPRTALNKILTVFPLFLLQEEFSFHLRQLEFASFQAKNWKAEILWFPSWAEFCPPLPVTGPALGH